MATRGVGVGDGGKFGFAVFASKDSAARTVYCPDGCCCYEYRSSPKTTMTAAAATRNQKQSIVVIRHDFDDVFSLLHPFVLENSVAVTVQQQPQYVLTPFVDLLPKSSCTTIFVFVFGV